MAMIKFNWVIDLQIQIAQMAVLENSRSHTLWWLCSNPYWYTFTHVAQPILLLIYTVYNYIWPSDCGNKTEQGCHGVGRKKIPWLPTNSSHCRDIDTGDFLQYIQNHIEITLFRSRLKLNYGAGRDFGVGPEFGTEPRGNNRSFLETRAGVNSGIGIGIDTYSNSANWNWKGIE